MVPALGGPERQLTEALFRWRPVWSPDGKYLVVVDGVSDDEALVAFSLETGEKRPLSRPGPRRGGVVAPAFSPDGRTLAFTRAESTTSAVYLLDVDENLQPTGEERQLTLPRWRARFPTWTAGGSEVVFVSDQNAAQASLMRIAISGGQPRPVALGAGGSFPAISRQGNRLAFVTWGAGANIWRVKVAGPGGKAGPPTRLIASTRTDLFPRYSPDGRKIAFVSTRSGSRQIWVCDSDGSNAKRLTDAFDAADTPDWSPDGDRIAFMSRTETEEPEIYVTDTRGGVPKRLTTDSASDALPLWSRDGQWIYFSSGRGGRWAVWKMPAEGGQAIPVTRGEGVGGRESHDGRFLYYSRAREFPFGSIWRMPLGGGEESLVVSGVFGPPALVEEGIYFIAKPGPDGLHFIRFFDFATEETTLVAPVEHPQPQSGLTVSPDGQSILYSERDPSGSDIMLIENFR